MAEGQVCCCGTNRGWLLFIVILNIISSILGIFASIYGIINIDSIDWTKHDAEGKSTREIALIFLWIFLAVCVIIMLVNLLPIIAETKKKPKLHLAFRNWLIVVIIFAVLHLIAMLVGVRGSGGEIGNSVFGIVVNIFTLVLVQRRMQELADEIGPQSFLKFV